MKVFPFRFGFASLRFFFKVVALAVASCWWQISRIWTVNVICGVLLNFSIYIEGGLGFFCCTFDVHGKSDLLWVCCIVVEDRVCFTELWLSDLGILSKAVILWTSELCAVPALCSWTEKGLLLLLSVYLAPLFLSLVRTSCPLSLMMSLAGFFHELVWLTDLTEKLLSVSSLYECVGFLS